MTLHIPRLPFALDPLIAEAKRRARQRRMLIGLAVLLLAGLSAGLTFVFRSPGGSSPHGGGLTSANYSSFGVSLRYPAAWTRLHCVNWFGDGTGTPISLLTSAQPAPTCPRPFTESTFPPPQRLRADGVMVFLFDTEIPGYVRLKWNARVDHQPASVPLRTFGAPKFFRAHYLTGVYCPASVRREYRAAYVKRPQPRTIVEAFAIGALICGPDIAAGDAAVRNLVASMRVTN
jgi:hypothetical protein